MQISEEVAKEQFEQFCEYYDFDAEDATAEDVRVALDAATARIIKAIMRGRLEVKDVDGDITVRQVLKHPMGDVSELSYGVLTGKAKIAMEKKKKQDDHHGKIYALLGSLSGLGEGAISSLRGADLSTAECVGMVFLQV